MYGPLAVPVQLAELNRLEALGRTRALTDEESATLENLIHRERQRTYRAHASRNRQRRQQEAA